MNRLKEDILVIVLVVITIFVFYQGIGIVRNVNSLKNCIEEIAETLKIQGPKIEELETRVKMLELTIRLQHLRLMSIEGRPEILVRSATIYSGEREVIVVSDN